MSITIHTGNPRTGKTYGLTKTLIKCLNQGFKVTCNYWIDWNGYTQKKWNWKKFKFDYIYHPKENLTYWKELSDLYEYEKGIIGMDEASVYLNSRKWAMLPEDFERKLYQHGKDGLHIIGTVPNIRRLDTIMRELVDYWYAYKVFPPVPKQPWKKHNPKLFFRWQIIMETDMSPRKINTTPTIYLFKSKFAKRYNTLEKINI